ncbi:MAG: hypothetical protein IT428_13620 [Planctomycetaceae bacterium]|nr:hypothetical protein [Planctomycetaceae bacterium]
MRVLIIGYGKMGRIHGKHLTELGVPWDYCDPLVAHSVGLNRLPEFTHVIVATPIDTHHDVFRALHQFAGRILIEKPVAILHEHLHVLDDPRVFPGMSERFNDAAPRSLPSGCCLIEFARQGTRKEVAIHDLDLFCQLTGATEWEIEHSGSVVIVRSEGVRGVFRWHEGDPRERTVTSHTDGGTVETFDLLHPRTPPILSELRAFLGGHSIDARAAHRLLVEIMGADEVRTL